MNRSNSGLIIALTAVLVLSVAAPLAGVSLHPNIIQKLRSEGRLDAYVADMRAARAAGVWQPEDVPLTRRLEKRVGPDTFRIVVLLVEFSDKLASAGGAYGQQSYFENLLFSDGVVPTGSMREYYKEVSYGDFVLIGEVYGWFMMPQTYAYYVNGQRGFGPYPNNAQKLAEDAVAVADPTVNFLLYDNSGDGRVEGLVLVHPGTGYEETGNDNEIHSHRWNMRTVQSSDDGATLLGYDIQPEESPNSDNHLVQIGVFCHEFGHVLGLPDLYDGDYSSDGLSSWSIMASGSYNGGSKTPAHFDAWCKKQLGWITPVNLTANVVGDLIPRVEETPYAVRLWGNGVAGPQYFLMENRQLVGYDAFLPAPGMLVFHVDETVPGNDNENHYKVALEQADGAFDLEGGRGADLGDPYPGGSNNREFSDRTVPGSLAYNGDTTQVAVWNISNSDSLMTANLDIVYSRPDYHLMGYSYDETGGDGDTLIEAGEQGQLLFSLTNSWADGTGLKMNFMSNNSHVTFADPSIELGDLPHGGIITDVSNPLSFQVDSGTQPARVVLTGKLTDAAMLDTTILTFNLDIGGTQIMLVDHDNNDGFQLEKYFESALDSLKISYAHYSRDSLGTPAAQFGQVPQLYWFTGRTRDSALTSADVNFLRDFLDQGGRLFLTSQDAVELLSTSPDAAFLSDYLKCSYGGSAAFNSMVNGVDGTEIGGHNFDLITSGGDGAKDQTDQDIVTPLGGATSSLTYQSSGGSAGIEYAGSYRLVVWGFGLEAINSTRVSQGYETRADAIRKVYDFLAGRNWPCGDANLDNFVNVADAVFLINYVFVPGSPPPAGAEISDVSCDGRINVADAVYVINYVFIPGSPTPCVNCP